MPAYDSSNCSRECTGLNTVFSNAAMLAESGMSLPEILRMISNQTAIRMEGRDDHKVFANGVDAYAGTLVDKLEAGTGIAIAAAVPTGAKGRAALERVVTITATGETDHADHELLSATHTDTTAASGVTGDIIKFDGTWKRLGIGSSAQVLTVDGSKPAWKDIPSQTNPLLDGTRHTDTVDDDPEKGDLIYANATPKWDIRPISTAGDSNYRPILQVGTGGSADLPIWSTPTWPVSGANGDVLYYNAGVWTRLPVGAANKILTSNGTVPSWEVPATPAATSVSPWEIFFEGWIDSGSDPGTATKTITLNDTHDWRGRLIESTIADYDGTPAAANGNVTWADDPGHTGRDSLCTGSGLTTDATLFTHSDGATTYTCFVAGTDSGKLKIKMSRAGTYTRCQIRCSIRATVARTTNTHTINP